MSRPTSIPPWMVAAVGLALFVAPRPGHASAIDPEDEMTAVRLLAKQERWVESESLATVVLGRLEHQPAPDSLRMADALEAIGLSRIYRAAYSDSTALRAAERGLAIRQRHLDPDHLDVAAAHWVLGLVLDGTGRSDSALVHIERTRKIRQLRLAPLDTLIADAWSQTGIAHRNLRDYPQALDDFRQALAIRDHDQGGVNPAAGAILSQMGYCLDRLGEYDAARDTLERALDIFGRTIGPDGMRRSLALDYLSGVEMDVGNPALALDYNREALRVVRLNRPEDHPEVTRIAGNRANVLLMFRDYAGMRATLEPLIPWYEKRRGPDDLRTINNIANLAIACAGAGDTAAAMVHFRRIERALSARPGPPDANLPFALAWQGKILLLEHRPEAVREVCERGLRAARAMRRPAGFTMALLHYVMLEAAIDLGDTVAIDSTVRSLDRLAVEFSLDRTATSRVVSYWDARAARSLGHDAQAWAYGLEAFRRAHDSICWNVHALPDGRALEVSADDLRQLDLLVDLSRHGPQERLEGAWDRLVRSRGLARAEMERRRLPAALKSDTAVVHAHDAWLSAQRSYARGLVVTGGAGKDSSSIAELERLRSDAETSERAYVSALQSHQSPIAPPEVSLADVRGRLQPGQALVSVAEYKVAAETAFVTAFIARGGHDEIVRVDLGRSADLYEAIDPWLGQLASPPGSRAAAAERACRRAGRAARAATWDPIARAIGDAGDVFVVADGPLLDFPWQALPDGNDAYLVERGPRVHVLDAEWELVAPRAPVSSNAMLAVGDPDFDSSAPGSSPTPGGRMVAAVVVRAAPDPCSGGAGLALTSLPASAAEAGDAARAWLAGAPDRQAEVLVGRDATESAVKREASGRAILHFATHALVSRDTCEASEPGRRGVGGIEPVAHAAMAKHPTAATGRAVTDKHVLAETPQSPWADRRVWIALAGANHSGERGSDENDGLLTAEEVITLDLGGTDWVVLSACHSGLGVSMPREGTLGLRRAFHLAGARTVIASDWAVEDEATRDWMHALYDARRTGATGAAEAMQAASRSALVSRRQAKRSTHPFYWAAFTATGE